MNGLTGKQMTIARLKMRGIHKNGISFGERGIIYGIYTSEKSIRESWGMD